MSYDQTKKLQRDFLTNFTILKKILARAPNLTSLWKLKNHVFPPEGQLFSRSGRKILLVSVCYAKIGAFLKFSTIFSIWWLVYLSRLRSFSVKHLNAFELGFERFASGTTESTDHLPHSNWRSSSLCIHWSASHFRNFCFW